jgi:uncharacterized protein YuzE
MEKNIEISYDEIEDMLYLTKKEKVKFSIDIAMPSGDVIVDIGFDGLIKGIEIFNASKFFSIIKEELIKIKNASINTVYSPSYTSISINLESEKAIRNNLVIPYSKSLIL